MNRYGDTPLGMVESALEFVRIAEAEGFHDLILSMKASNPKVMIQAYRLLVERMDAAHRPYPLHLGVTEAGDGEDGRIKGAIGIGALLLDGLGDTIRVSLTEDSVYEIPVARAIADKAMSLWAKPDGEAGLDAAAGPVAAEPPTRRLETTAIDHFTRRETAVLRLSDRCVVGPEQPPRVIVRLEARGPARPGAAHLAAPAPQDTPVEGLMVPVADAGALATLRQTWRTTDLPADFLVLELGDGDRRPRTWMTFSLPVASASSCIVPSARPTGNCWRRSPGSRAAMVTFSRWTFPRTTSRPWRKLSAPRGRSPAFQLFRPAVSGPRPRHALGAYRLLADRLARLGCRAPIWIRNTAATAVRADPSFLGRLIEASFLTGGLLCDGLGDLVSMETEADPVRALKLAYNLLQGAGTRISKTEFVACPSCGRTLFDLQTTTQRIREKTGHLKGVKIAIMGCIVNGPGEMADADFGYVGGAPGKINLYVGQELRAVQPAAGGGRRPPDRAHQGAREMAGAAARRIGPTAPGARPAHRHGAATTVTDCHRFVTGRRGRLRVVGVPLRGPPAPADQTRSNRASQGAGGCE